MRTTLYQLLTEECESVLSWHQPYQPTATTPKPYGVIAFQDTVRSPFNRLGAWCGVDIWVYAEPGSFLALDAAAEEVVGILLAGPFQLEDGIRVELELEQVGRDFYDQDLRAVGRCLSFRAPVVLTG